MLVNTVRENFEGYSCHEVEKAKEVRRTQGMIANPTQREFAGMVREQLLTNCPVTVQDVDNANRIFGPDLANLRGKTTRTKPEHVRVEYVQIPRDFVQLQKYVTLVADVMFVNGLPFLVTSSQGLSLVTIEHRPSRTAKHLVQALERVFRIYATTGFIVQTAMMDMEFEKLKPLMPHVALHTMAAQEHVGEIEQKIRVIKERARGTFNTLPYKKLPRVMLIELLHFCVMWMNSFPIKSGISDKWRVSRTKLDAKLHCRAPFRSYCEMHIDPDITNTLEPRTNWGICMGPTGNLQGSYKFLSLATGKKVTRRKFTEMPVTDAVIKQVEEMAVKDGAIKGINFKDKKGLEYEFDNDEEYEMLVEPDEPAPFPDIPADAPGMLTETEEEYGIDDVVQDEPEMSDEQRAVLAANNSGLDFSSIPTKVTGGEVIEILDDDEKDVLNEYERDEVLVKIKPDQTVGATAELKSDKRRSGQIKTANRRFEDYELYTTVEEEEQLMLATVEKEILADDEEDEEVLAAVAHFITVHYKEKEGITKKKKKKYKPKAGQYQMEVGIKRFGERGEIAVTTELDQFNKYKVFEPKHAYDLSEEDRKKALSSLIFLKEKKNGTIKARSCANGSVQREHIAKEEAAVPTNGLDSVFITSTIDAKESRKVVTINIPGAFLHADNEDYVIMKMVGTLAELMVKTNPKMYRQYVILEKGKSVLYMA
jgi:hypothetical protein